MIKTFTGYHLPPGVAPEDHDKWLRTSYASNCLSNPHLDALVFNWVGGVVRGERTFYGIEERHFADTEAFAQFDAWNEENPRQLQGTTTDHRLVAFSVLTESVNVDRANMNEMIRDPSARVATQFSQPGSKTVLGYDIVPNMTVRDYETWLWEIHTPDLLANPNLERIVFNTVTDKLDGEESFFRISELHVKDESSFEAWAEWRARNPVPVEHSPLGKTAFRFFVRTSVEALARPR